MVSFKPSESGSGITSGIASGKNSFQAMPLPLSLSSGVNKP